MNRPKYLRLFFIFIIIFLPFKMVGQEIPSEIVDMKRLYRLKGDKLHLKGSTTIQINNRMGDKDANVYIFYSRGDNVRINDAWIQDLRGNIIRKLRRSEISDISAVNDFTLYSDRYVKKFELIHNQYPYQLVYNYEVERKNYIDIERIDYRNRLQPIRNAEITVETASDIPIKFYQENINKPIIQNLENTFQYTWHFGYLPCDKFEIMTNYNTIGAPILIILPHTFKYKEVGDYNSWQSFGQWLWLLNTNRDILPESEKKIITNLIQGIDSPKEKARVLYHYMQDNTRYVNISIKIGGLQTYPAEYVCANRYGDCKALTNYMQSMLKYIGIDSYYTIIESGRLVNDFDSAFPHNAFNHVILTIPFQKDTTYLECTSQNLAFGYINTSIQGRKALLVDKDNSHLIYIPKLKLEDVKTTRRIEIDLFNETRCTGQIIAMLKGEQYELYKEIQNGINKNIADIYIHNNILNGSYSIDNYQFIDNVHDSSNISLKASFTINNIMKKFGNNIVINPFSWNLASWELPEKRKQNIQIDFPIFKEDTILYNLSRYIIKSLPEDIELTTPYGEYIVKYNIEDNYIKVTKSVRVYAARYQLSEYNDFYWFINQILNNENKKIYLEIQ